MVAQGLGLEVVFPRFRAPEPERDESKKSNATLQVRISRNPNELLSLRRCAGRTLRRQTLRTAPRRIDLHVEVLRIPFDEIVARTAGESSAAQRCIVRAPKRGLKSLRT
jgi:hypothetical protein